MSKERDQIIRTIMTIVKSDWLSLQPDTLKQIEKIYGITLKELSDVLESI